MLLRSQHDILCPGALEDIGPVIRINELSLELGREVLIRKIRPVHLLVVVPGPGLDGCGLRIVPAIRHGVPIPLRVCELAGNYRGITRDGVNAPMDEDAEFRVGEPGGSGALIERAPGGLVSLSAEQGCGSKQKGEKPGRLHGGYYFTPEKPWRKVSAVDHFIFEKFG